MLVVGLDGLIVQANAAFAGMVGRDPDELGGQSFADLTCAEDVPNELALMTSLVSGQTSNVVREKRYRRADGTLVTAVSSTTVIRDAAGTATAVMSHVKSIDDRRRAEESLLERQSAMDAIITADSEGRVTAWNDGAERLFGHTRSQALGQPVAMIVPPEARDAHTAGIARVAGGGAPHLVGRTVELTSLRRDGSRLPVELSLSTWS